MEAVIETPTTPLADTGREGWAGTPAESWQKLFQQLAEGNIAALGRLYELSADRLYGLALWHTGSGEDAQDVVQETFVRVAQQRHRLRRVRRPRAWLLTITHRLAVDVVRRRGRRRDESLDAFPYLEATVEDPGRAADADRLARLVASLPPAQRDVLFLRHFADCSFSEIGRIVGVPLFTAASRYRLGLAKIRTAAGGSHEKS